ncbi:MAG TPA: SDR family NAD(P)-dependent oxidoreductase, partial [Ktedonobacterales bacterium]|nr:SDR family NAD(P)-dependent oxidoreductase [Ktedonobacterales bacterium]
MTLIRDQVVLVTGASRGLGKAFVAELLARGAKKVYATARDPRTIAIDDARVVPLPLDITDAASVNALAAQVGDLTMLVNNAGILVGASLL